MKDYENFEKGMIYMKISKKGGGREKGGGGNEIHAPCACVTMKLYRESLYNHITWTLVSEPDYQFLMRSIYTGVIGP